MIANASKWSLTPEATVVGASGVKVSKREVLELVRSYKLDAAAHIEKDWLAPMVGSSGGDGAFESLAVEGFAGCGATGDL